MNLNSNEQEKLQQRKDHDKFNNVTQKNKPVNQNQTHNSKKEGAIPVNQQR